MIICFSIPLISKILAIIGLSLDVYGIFELFKLEPKPLDEANENIFEASLGEYTELQQVKLISKELNKNVQDMRFDSQSLRRKSKRFKNIILIGFILQIISIVLSFFCN